MTTEQQASAPASAAKIEAAENAELAQRLTNSRRVLVGRQFEELSAVMAERDHYAAKVEKLQTALMALSQQAAGATAEIEGRDAEIAALKAQLDGNKEPVAVAIPGGATASSITTLSNA